MKEMESLVARWQEARARRLELQAEAKALSEDVEKPLAQAILDKLAENDVESVRIKAGTVARKTDMHLWLESDEKVAEFMLRRMALAHKNKTPLANELYFQRHPAKNVALAYAKEKLTKDGVKIDHNSLNETLKEIGFSLHVTEELSFTKSK